MCILFYDRCDKMLNTHQTCPRFLREKGRLEESLECERDDIVNSIPFGD